MLTYRKGSRAERELIQHFSEKGFSVIRAAGSGVSSLSPDILLFRHGSQYAIESKAVEKESLALRKEQYLGLKTWEENTGITAYVAWRRNRQPWVFIPIAAFKENAQSFSVGWETANMIGKKIEEMA